MRAKLTGSLLLFALLCEGGHADSPATVGARLAPLPEAQWSPQTRALLAATLPRVSALSGEAKPGAKPLPILGVIAHHPTLLAPFLEFATTLAQRGVLPRRESELLALRTAWRSQSHFEWGHHVLYARAAGLSEAEIARVADQGDATLSARELLLLRAADQLHATQRIDDPTWDALRTELSDAQLVEIPFLVGQYTMLSMVAEALAVPVEPDLPALPPAQPARASH
ncbi:MAG TPA: carboxymuconolactone decarboxylase family protein [Myxococcota bacterium]|nr:carboxymuconolactone decarboxylase family protein [Myxococcota bacterium]